MFVRFRRNSHLNAHSFHKNICMWNCSLFSRYYSLYSLIIKFTHFFMRAIQIRRDCIYNDDMMTINTRKYKDGGWDMRWVERKSSDRFFSSSWKDERQQRRTRITKETICARIVQNKEWIMRKNEKRKIFKLIYL